MGAASSQVFTALPHSLSAVALPVARPTLVAQDRKRLNPRSLSRRGPALHDWDTIPTKHFDELLLGDVVSGMDHARTVSVSHHDLSR